MKTYTPKCNPPQDCFNCPYDDCHRNGYVTKSETDYKKTVELATTGCVSHLAVPLASEIAYSRNRRLV